MTTEREVFDLLRRAKPVAPEAVVASAVDEVLERILATPPVEIAQAPRRPVRRLALVVGTVAALAAVGWTAFTLRSEPSKPLTVGCYAAADLDSRTEVVVAEGKSPAEACRDLWRRGVFGAVAVPDLAECVLASGSVGVFPASGGDTCADVQAARLRPESSAGTPDVVALRQALVETFRAQGCLPAAPAREIVGRHLAERGFDGWTVEVTGTFGPERPCASLAFDVPASRILIIPVPRMP
jgi:hypothetical protein